MLYSRCIYSEEGARSRRSCNGIGVPQRSVPQAFDLLVYLVENRDRVMRRIGAGVGRRRIVSDRALTSHVNAARKAVGDSSEEQKRRRLIFYRRDR